MFKQIQALVLFCSVLAWTSGCDSKSRQEEFEDQAFGETPSGFVRTSEGGEILSEDGDDWRSAPAFESDLFLTPAYPNPAPVSELVRIPISLQGLAPGTLYVYARDASGRLSQELDRLSHAGTGFELLNFTAGLLGEPGLHRVFILDSAGALVSYGDVMVE